MNVCLSTHPAGERRCSLPNNHPGDHAVVTSKYGDGPKGVVLASWRNHDHPESKAAAS